MKIRVSMQWTETALESLRTLPKKVRQGLLDKADQLLACGDPRKVHKPLVGPLQGYYRITYARYRAIYRVDEEKTAKGELLLHLRVLFVWAGIRKEFDKKDVYRVATTLVKLVLEPGAAEQAQPKPRKKRR